MNGRRLLAAMVLLASVCALAAAKPLDDAGFAGASQERGETAAPLRESGSYVRRYWHIPLYRVTLEVPDPREIASRLQQSTGRSLEGATWNELAAFLLDPRNRLPVRLSMQIMIGLKSYPSESKVLRESLERVGLEIDESWRLQGNRELQGEVTRFAEAVIGVSPDQPGTYYRNRKKGDVYVFALDGSGGASLTYQPAADNRAARPGRTDFRDGRVVTALVRALLLPADSDEGASSAALLRPVREACAACNATAEASRPDNGGKT